MKKSQSGRSMIEMLGVLAIVGVLSAGGIAGYSMAMQSYKTSALTEKVNLIAQQARVMYEGGQYTDGDIGAQLIDAGMVTDLNNPFGGTLAVGSASSGGAAVTEFYVSTDPNIPSEACIKLLATDWGNTGVFTGIAAGAAAYSAVAGIKTAAASTGGLTAENGTANKGVPVAPENAVTYCSGGNKAIGWIFK